jgi:hydroxymethylglutaryl-CoA lyase
MNTGEFVRIVEVGPRDGLQNEATPLTVADKVQLVDALSRCGFSLIETGSFVSPKWVPQMAGSAEVFAGIQRRDGVRYSALTPNLQGFERALQAQVDEVAVFAAASEAFSQRNINCSIAESVQRFVPIIESAKQQGMPVRGYLSCVLGCPYSGQVDPQQVLDLALQLLELGCYEVSLGDTLGIGSAGSTERLLNTLTQQISPTLLAGHFHDTYGQALTNIYVCLQHGLRVFDSSVAGLGGCPYAQGASGNVASEDLLYLLHGLGFVTGIDLQRLIATGNHICQRLGRSNGSKVARAQSLK